MDKKRTLTELHIAVFLAGWTGLFGRFISINELPLVFYRMGFSSIALALFMLATHRFRKRGIADLAKAAGCGVILAIHWVLFYGSIKASNVSVGVVCFATGTFFTAIFEPLLCRKRFSPTAFLISFITIVGILLIFSLDVRYRLGIILGTISAGCYSIFSIMNIKVSDRTGFSTWEMLICELVGGVLALGAMLPLCPTLFPDAVLVPQRNDIIALIILAVVFTLIPYILQLRTLMKLDAFTVTVSYNLEPIYTIILAGLIFGEVRELGWSFWVGLVLITGSVLAQSLRVKERK